MQKKDLQFQKIMAKRGLVFHQVHEQYAIDGSPERCISRHVVEDSEGRLWLMEHVAERQRHSRNAIGHMLKNIAAYYNGVPVPRALVHEERSEQELNGDKKRIAQYIENTGEAWQVSPFYVGIELPRPKYLQEAWRGEALGRFLKGLYTASTHLDHIPPPHIHMAMSNGIAQHGTVNSTKARHYAEPHNITYYVAYMAEHVRKQEILIKNPQKLEGFNRVCAHLEKDLPKALEAQVKVLAHGDLHPLNCIWGKESLVGIIDWEFCGARPLLYDMANCLGCCGFEHPSGLIGKFAMGLVETVRGDRKGKGEEGFITQEEMRFLPVMVMASRFAWLSEWCKKRDYDMLAMELEYLQILLYNHERLCKEWSAL